MAWTLAHLAACRSGQVHAQLVRMAANMVYSVPAMQCEENGDSGDCPCMDIAVYHLFLNFQTKRPSGLGLFCMKPSGRAIGGAVLMTS